MFDTEQLIESIVDWLSQEVVLSDDSFEALEFFQSQLSEKSLRYQLAAFQQKIQEGDMSWEMVEELAELMVDETSRPTPRLVGLVQIQAVIQELLELDHDDEDQLEKLENKAKSLATKGTVKLTKSLIDAYRKGTEKEMLQQEPFPVDYARREINQWIKMFMRRLGVLHPPEALKRDRAKRKRNDDDETENRVGNLKQARRKLRADVEDPLPGARAVAQSARGGEMYVAKASATRLRFSQEEDDDEIDDPERIQLSEVPKKATIVKKESSNSPHEFGSHLENRSPGRRRRWTDEEKLAVKAGVEKFGAGKWIDIKDHYHDILKGRTNGMIKDCYRTLVRQGVIEEESKP